MILCASLPWPAASKLEEANGQEAMPDKVIPRGIKSLAANGVVIDRDWWLKVGALRVCAFAARCCLVSVLWCSLSLCADNTAACLLVPAPQEAEASEKSTPPMVATCRAIVKEVVGHGVEEQDRKRTWMADAGGCA